MPNSLTETAVALQLRRILTPVDFSDRCRRAADYAEALARHYNAELILLHAVAPIGIPFGAAEALAYSDTADLTAQRVKEKTVLLEGFLVNELHGVTTRRVLTEADPAEAILECASGQQCDLIVMPTHGYGAIQRFLAGSITAEVIRHAQCPVWTGPHFEDAPAPTFQNILCALDLAKESRAVLAWAAGFAREFGARLRIVHAIPKTTVRSGAMYFDPDWHAHVAQEARRQIDEFQHDVGSAAGTQMELGDIPDGVVGAARDAGADLLVIGRGPKSYGIIRAAPCPVVAV